MNNLHNHLADFNGTSIEITDYNGQHWLTGEQVGIAIGLKHPRQGITKLYNRHADEFTDEMAGEAIVGSPQGGKQKTRIFSPRGAWMLAMWAQTDKAKDFRAWVLDVLEAKNDMAGLDIPTHIRRELLRANPVWQKIARYKAMGLNHNEIGCLLKRGADFVRGNVRRMERCGIIEPPANLLKMQQQSLNFLPSPIHA